MALFDDPSPDQRPDDTDLADDELRRLVGDELALFAERAGDIPAAVAHSHLVGIGLAWTEGADDLAAGRARATRRRRLRVARRTVAWASASVVLSLVGATGLAAAELLPEPAARLAASFSDALGLPSAHVLDVAAGRAPEPEAPPATSGGSLDGRVDTAAAPATSEPPVVPVPTTLPPTSSSTSLAAPVGPVPVATTVACSTTTTTTTPRPRPTTSTTTSPTTAVPTTQPTPTTVPASSPGPTTSAPTTTTPTTAAPTTTTSTPAPTTAPPTTAAPTTTASTATTQPGCEPPPATTVPPTTASTASPTTVAPTTTPPTTAPPTTVRPQPTPTTNVKSTGVGASLAVEDAVEALDAVGDEDIVG